jgi:hypothetical protein
MLNAIKIRFGIVGTGLLIGWTGLLSAPAQSAQTLTVPIDQLISPTATNPAPLVDFRVLKTLLPETLPGFRRIQISGEKSGIMGISIAFAEALYRNETTGNLSLKITDMGGMRSIMLMAQAGWATTESDRETETGYERTTAFGGFKGFEEYDHAQHHGEIRILLGTRFLVEISGTDVEPETLRSSAETIDYIRLAGLVPNLSPPASSMVSSPTSNSASAVPSAASPPVQVEQTAPTNPPKPSTENDTPTRGNP